MTAFTDQETLPPRAPEAHELADHLQKFKACQFIHCVLIDTFYMKNTAVIFAHHNKSEIVETASVGAIAPRSDSLRVVQQAISA